MKHKLKRLLSSVLAAATMFSTVAGALPQAAAFSAGDSVTLIFENDKQSCLKEKKGRNFGEFAHSRVLCRGKRCEISKLLHGSRQARNS